MPWTAPRSWAVGEIVTASMLNTHLRDNELWLYNGDGCALTHSVAQSIPASTETVLAFDTERQDTSGYHDTVTNNSRITIPRAGGCWVGANVRFAYVGDTLRMVALRLNGSTVIAKERVPEPTHTATTMSADMIVSRYYRFVAGDYVEVVVWHNESSALDVVKANEHSPEFWAVKA